METFSARPLVLFPSVLAILAFGISSCAPTIPVTSQSENSRIEGSPAALPSLEWMFDGDIELGIPSTDVYIVVNGDHYDVGDNAQAEYNELKPGEGAHWGIPADRLLACSSWFAGAGDVFYVMNEGGKLAVYRKLLEEGSAETPFRRIKTISY